MMLLVTFVVTALLLPVLSSGLVATEGFARLEELYPTAGLGERVRLGKLAQGLRSGTALRPQDPEQARTYGEFSVESFATCVDAALEGLPDDLAFVDVGSGTGRLAMAASLLFPERFRTVRGLEISPLLHSEATATLRRAEDEGFVERGTVFFERKDVLEEHETVDGNFFFVYATAFPAPTFSEELRAPILNDQWTTTLAKMLEGRPCRILTTDRALNPAVGFKMVDVIANLPNRETLTSTVYVHDFDGIVRAGPAISTDDDDEWRRWKSR